MAIQAVAFDIGDVLERIAPFEEFSERWRLLLGMTGPDFAAALETVDPHRASRTGALTEVQLTERYAAALGMSESLTAEFTADMWDWYCGELDAEMVGFAASLRPRLRTGILSNSVAGARREEQARYGFAELVDVVVYSHEIGVAKPEPEAFRLLCRALGVQPAELVFLDDVPGHIEVACQLGIHGIVHVAAPNSIAAVEALIGNR